MTVSKVKLYRADWRHVVQTAEDDAQYVGINDYKNKCHSSDAYYRAWKHSEKELNAAQSELTALKAELASEEKDHAELRDVVAALREERVQTEAERDACLLMEATLRKEKEALIEDRARFPDRPDFIGNMISAHIGNLKAGKESSDNYARNYILKNQVLEQRLTAAEQRNAILEAEIKKLTPWVKGVGSTKLRDHAYQLIASAPCEKCNGKGFIHFTDTDLRNANNGDWGRCLTCRPYDVSLAKPTESGASE